NIILQTIVEEDKRGRVMSLFTLSFMGTVPFGSLCAGILAKLIGAQATIALGASVCIFGALLYILFYCRSIPSKK
ncbi:MAG: MFS transporter, partial [Syntrophus sp. (in: bacteria)]